MTRSTSIVAIALMSAACSPAGQTNFPTAPAASVASLPAKSCAQAGGTMTPVGRLRTAQCVVAYADAGKSCSSGEQCAGDCLTADAAVEPRPGARVAGVCQADSSRFGCHTRVEGGVALGTICID